MSVKSMLSLAALIIGMMVITLPANADDVTINVAGGARVDTVFDTTDDTSTFAVDNVRLTSSVETSYGIGADISVQYDGTDTNNIGILDASLNVDVPIMFVDEIKVGRFLAPQDRAGLAGDYGQITWELPTVVSKYPSVSYGRQDGVAISGGAADVTSIDVPTSFGFNQKKEGTTKKEAVSFNYALGAFQGITMDCGVCSSNPDDDPLVAGRVGVDVGALDVAFAFQHQHDAFAIRYIIPPTGFGQDNPGQVAYRNGDFFGWNVDGAYSMQIGTGTAIVNGGYYDYDLDGASYVPGHGLNEGNGGYILGAYTLGEHAFQVGSLAVTPQPFLQYQEFKFKGARRGHQERWDAGANFILNAATNSKLTVAYFNDELVGVTNEGVVVGIQVAF